FDTTKSWYTETIDATYDACNPSTHDRCGTKYFPEKAYIVLTLDNVYIFDAEENALWMKFNAAVSLMIYGSSSIDNSSVYMLNGRMYVGTRGGGVGALNIVDFLQDKRNYIYTSGTVWYEHQLGIGSRNSTSHVSVTGTYGIVNREINDVHAAVINGKTYVAVATDGGVSVINETDGTVKNFGSTGYSGGVISSSVFLVQDRLYLTQGGSTTQGQMYKIEIPSTDWTNGKALFTAGDVLIATNGYSSFWPQISNHINHANSLYVTEGTSSVDGTSNTVYFSTYSAQGSAPNGGAIILQEKQGDDTNGSLKFFTKDYISEEMVGDIRGMWPMYGTLGATIANNTYNIDDVSVKSSELTAK
ncbi:hypothetical protein CO179_00305, partial [candidate division WWE3 bacterium CG_4_9_14_3_um_filter_39_7]